MTLAVILSICVLFSSPVSVLAAAPGWTQASGQGAAPSQTPDASAEQNQDQDQDQDNDKAKSPQNPPAPAAQAPPSSAAPSSAAPPKTSSGQSKPAAGTRRRRKKKAAVASGCTDPAPAAGAPPSPTSSTGDTAAATEPPSNCPPPKTVVHDGGTSEPAIQLTGGVPGPQSQGKRSTTDQLLGSTQDNLKKIEGRQLNASQQEMVNQIHQFLQQSKAAVAAGDLDRGHNLAMKARLLSDELTKP